jgi:catechol 2,3-dioxygenase-like lactoylglutathione lyase family enzyme
MEFSEPVTTFVVEDVGASLAFYRDVLEFAQTFAVGDPPIFAGVHRDHLALYLQRADQTDRPPGGGAVSVRVDDARAVHARLGLRGATALTAAEKRPYGLVDFTVRDPDGNQITVGSIVTADSPPAPQGGLHRGRVHARVASRPGSRLSVDERDRRDGPRAGPSPLHAGLGARRGRFLCGTGLHTGLGDARTHPTVNPA